MDASVLTRSIVIGTAGHIDHGKSALVRALTGIDPDRLKEEKARGITIDLGFAHLVEGDVHFAFVDVPGHERFVRNMLAGAGGIDAVLLVVAADESVMPQTREHFAICRLLNVSSGAIVLTKSDLADPDTLELVALEVREMVAGSFLEHAPLVAVSSKTGEGLDALKAALGELVSTVRPRHATGTTRLPVDRVFTLKGFGTVVTGTLVSGTLREGQSVSLLPGSLAATVRGLQVHGHQESSAEAGQRTAVNLAGINVTDIERGVTLCTPGSFAPTRRLDVVVDLLPASKPLRHGARVRFHQGTSELIGRIALAGRGDEGPASDPLVEIQPGQSAQARLRLERPAVVTRGDRFILRAYSPPMTIGGGSVLDPEPPRGAIRTSSGLARFRRVQPSVAPAEVLMTFIEERGFHGLPRPAVLSRAGLSPDDSAQVVARLVAAGRIAVIGDLLVSQELLKRAANTLVTALEAHHAADPLSEGLHREEARERLMPRAPAAVFDAVVEPLAASGTISSRERLSLAGHTVSLSGEEQRIREALVRLYFDAGLAPLDQAAARAAVRADERVADRMLALLIRQRTLVKIDNLLFHAERLEALKEDLRKLKTAGTAVRLDVGTFKERYGVTRKFAIPLLEYLDRERVTRRVGESRVLV
ncbi:MAG: selenocysteine-specific translation elongation factor [Vicinamibacterales bacterium]